MTVYTELPSLDEVLQSVTQRVVPAKREREKMDRLSAKLVAEVDAILRAANVTATVSLQGSYARDTWISGETDLDIFARLPISIERREWIERVLPALQRRLARFKPIERYAEHPFLEFHLDGTRVNVVLCYDVRKGEWKSATDRTPYHTEFMKANLTEELRLQARLLKKFSKGIGAYGAEIKIGGFSGMLIDTLALYYRSFVETLKSASSWTHGTLLEIGKPMSTLAENGRGQPVDLLVKDPVDPDRNLAAALRPDKLWKFVAAGRWFMENPTLHYFFPPKVPRKTEAQFLSRIKKSDQELVAVAFNHKELVPDILWGQLIRLEKSLVEMMNREDFRTLRAATWSDERTASSILFELDRAKLPSFRFQIGPPVSKEDDSRSFLERHLGHLDTIRGPWIEGDRWRVEKKRRITSVNDLLRISLGGNTQGFAVPKQMGESLSRSMRVLQGKAVLSLLEKKGFAEFLWRFLEAKPQWLRPTRS